MMNPAHIHPLVVQLPLMILPASTLIQLMAYLKKEDLGSNSGYSILGFRVLVLGIVLAYFSVRLGDIALDKALAFGFPGEPLRSHQVVSLMAFGLFSISALFQAVFRWKKIPLKGSGGSLFIITLNLTALLILVGSAYTGLMLVLDHGVNIN